MTIASEGGTPEPTGNTALYEVPGEFERGYLLGYEGQGGIVEAGDRTMAQMLDHGWIAGRADRLAGDPPDVLAAWLVTRK